MDPARTSDDAAPAGPARGGRVRRALLAGSGTALLVALGTAGYLTGSAVGLDGGTSSALPAPTARATSSPTAGTPSPSRSDDPSPSPRGSAPPAPGPGAACPVGVADCDDLPDLPDLPPDVQAPARPRDVLLTVQDAARAEPGDWQPAAGPARSPLLDPCPGGTSYPREADVVERVDVRLDGRREAGGTALAQSVSRYRSAEAASDAWLGYGRAVRGCPSRPDAAPPGSTTTHEVVAQGPDGPVDTLLVRSASTCPACSTAHAYYAVQLRGDVVSVLAAARGEDGDPGPSAVTPFATAVAARLG